MAKAKRKRGKLPFELPKLDPAQTTQLVAILLAMVLAVLVNVFAQRRYTRWDWTSNKRYTLTPATVQTLHDLPGTVDIWVLLGSADPLEQSVKQLLVAYQAETTKLDVRYVDPDRDTAALEDLKKRFKIETGRTEQGHVVADAVVVVAHGGKHWFLTTSDMVEVSGDDSGRVKPKEERAFTSAIRNVLGSERTKVCFTTGHGEMNVLDASEHGAGQLKDVLQKDNFDVTTVETSVPNVPEPFKGCGVVVVAGLRAAFGEEEAERLRTYALGGGNVLLAASPITGDSVTGFLPAGLDRALSPFGIALDDDVVVEDDPALAFPASGGLRFVAIPKQHAVTAALVKVDNRDVPRTVLAFSRSMHHVSESGSATPSDLLGTSERSFGLASVAGASDWKETPAKQKSDREGPLVVAMAAERPKISADAPHGPRLVVLGSASPLTTASLREPLTMRGGALLVESAISWLAAKPQVLDVPDKGPVAAGMRITDDDRSAIKRYVLLLMPMIIALLGLAVGVWRKRTEGAKST